MTERCRHRWSLASSSTRPTKETSSSLPVVVEFLPVESGLCGTASTTTESESVVGKQNTGKIGEAERRNGCTRGGPLAGGREREKEKVSKTQMDRDFRRGRRRLERSPPFVWCPLSSSACFSQKDFLAGALVLGRHGLKSCGLRRTTTEHQKPGGVRSLLPAVCAFFPQVPSCDCLSRTSSFAPQAIFRSGGKTKKRSSRSL